MLGRLKLSSGLQQWWKKWTEKRKQTSPGTLLALAVRDKGALQPVAPLADWLERSGWGGRELVQARANLWLRRWNLEMAQKRASALTPSERGPGAERQALAAHFKTGRDNFQKLHNVTGIWDNGGNWTEKHAE
eukprot:9205653-Pyramimonas_sp.AAC.1